MYLPGWLISFTHELITIPLNKKVAFIVKENNQSPVLDICCQRGRKCKHLFDVGVKTFGLDINRKMLLARPAAWKSIPVVCADASRIPFADSSIPVVLLTFSLHDKSQDIRIKIIDEAKRVLMPEGKIIITDFDNPWNFKTKICFLLTLIKEVFSGHLANGVNFFNCGGVLKFVADQGLTIILLKRSALPPISTVVVSKGGKRTD